MVSRPAPAGTTAPPLSSARSALDQLGGQSREIGERALLDLAAVAIALAQQDGGRRVAVRHGSMYMAEHNIPIMSTKITYITWVHTSRKECQKLALPQ